MANQNLYIVDGAGGKFPILLVDNGDTPTTYSLATGTGGASSVTPDRVSLTDRSGSITAGGTAQTAMNANSSRKYLLIQNNSSGNLWFNFGIAAVQNQPSILLQPGQSFVMEDRVISTQSVSIIGATTGQTFTAKEA